MVLGKGGWKIWRVRWGRRGRVIGMGKDCVLVVSEDVEVFKVGGGGRFRKLWVEVRKGE